MSLTHLDVSGTPVEDIAALRGMKLEWISLFRTRVRDLSPLSGMPIKYMELRACDQLTDVMPLGQIPSLESIHLPAHAADLEPLRKLPNLKNILFGSVECTAKDFWKTWDGLPWARKLEAAGITFDIEQLSDGYYDVRVHDPKFTDCSIFTGSNVRSVDLDSSGVTDLSPLADLPLKILNLRDTKVTDLSPLRSPVLRDALREIRLWKTKIADFSPIAECKNLEVFDASDTLLPDLSVVKGMKLRTLNVERTSVTDIAPLTGMPLEDVYLRGTKVTDILPLLKCPTLKSLMLPEDARDFESLHALPNLTRISYTSARNDGPDMTADQFWTANKDEPWLAALRKTNLTYKTRLLKDGSWELILDHQPISDLSMLKGASITRLSIASTPVADLSPLRGMKLTFLRISGTKVSDLSPIRGMPITNVTMTETNVRDLTPLVGMPLRSLNMPDCKQIADLSPLAEIKTLESVILPPDTKNIEGLRKLPNLKRLGYKFSGSSADQTVQEFWAAYDRTKSASAP
ncbi:MAG TPA: hypothetical protein VFE46_03160 [Pirellulales bacterium]|jgi:hypothetical protein|nr:hypothetical protein [Pirellulales bacterium]